MGQPVTLMVPDPVTGVEKLVGSTAAPFATQESPASGGVTTSVTSVTTVATLKAANTARKSLIVNNDSTSILYILLGTGTVSATNYTYSIAAKGAVAGQVVISGFTGAVTGTWSAANGFATVTELT